MARRNHRRPFALVWMLTWFVLAAAVFPVAARADNEGQADLDKATDQKLSAESAGDLAEVIQLCESALKKGLDKKETLFANDLMASALVQRGTLNAKNAFGAIVRQVAEAKNPKGGGGPKDAKGGMGDFASGTSGAAGDWKTYRREALADLEKGLKLSPNQPQAQFEIAKLNLLPGGDSHQAMVALDKTIALAGDDAALRAEALVRRAGLRDSTLQRLADLNEAVRALPGNAQVLRARGLLHAEAEQWDEALADFDKSIAADPKQALTYQMKAEVLVKLKKPAEALAVLEKAHAIAPRNGDVLVAKSRILITQAEFQAAADELTRALAIDGSSLPILELRAALYEHLGKKDLAMADIEKLLQIKPGQPNLMRMRAMLLADQGKHAAAVEELTRALAIDGSSLPILELRASLYEQLGDKAKELGDIEKILQIKPGQPNLMRARAGLLGELGKFDDAVKELQELHKANPNDSLTMLQLGRLYLGMKKYDKAVDVFTAILADRPDDVAAMQGRADAQLNLGRRANAVSDYERAFKIDAHDVGILNNYAWVLATAPENNLRDGHRALELATDACRLTEYKQDFILSTLAAAYAETGDFESARKWAAQAVEVKPSPNAETSRKDELKKELESYQANKPWREALPAADEKKADEKKADEKRADEKKDPRISDAPTK